MNSSLPTFFASVIGTKSLNLTATSSATIYTGVISSFSATGSGEGASGGYSGWGQSYSSSGSSGTFNNLLLPVGLDAVAWSSYINTGKSPSDSTYSVLLSSSNSSGSDWYISFNAGNSSSSSTSNWWDCDWNYGTSCSSKTDNGNGNDGVNRGDDQSKSNQGSDTNINTWNNSGTSFLGTTTYSECSIFPCPSNFPGMVSSISLDGSSTADSTMCSWIINGATSSDIKSLCSNNCFPCSTSAPKGCHATAGMTSTVATAFSSIVGQKRIMPVFRAVSISPYQACSGTGSTTQMQVCGFVGVQITSVSGSGSNTKINVKPCSVIDPTAVFDKSTLVPCGCEPSSQLKTYTCTTPKFCQ